MPVVAAMGRRVFHLLCLAASAATMSGCGQSTPLVLDLAVSHGGGTVAGEARTFTTAGGQPVRLEEALVTLEVVDLLPCSPFTVELAPRWRRVVSRLRLVAVAHAHAFLGPTTLAAPFVESLTRPDDEPAVLGTLEPDGIEFCRVAVTFGPADADAGGFDRDGGMFGASLHLKGTYGEESLKLYSTDKQVVYAQLDPPLQLTPDTPEGCLLIDLRYDRWFDGFNPSMPTGASVLFGAREGIEVRWSPGRFSASCGAP